MGAEVVPVANAAINHVGDDDMTTVLPRRVVVPFRNRRAPASDETKTFALPRSPLQPQPAAPAPETTRAPVAARAPAARAPSARTVRKSTPARSVILVLAAAIALWSIFALGILVGRTVRPHLAHAASTPPAGGLILSAAQPEPPVDALGSVASAESGEIARADSMEPIITLSPVKEHTAKRAHGTKKSAGHGLAAVSKRAVTKHDDARGAASPHAGAPAEADDSATDDADDLGAASAADELARAQLEAVMP
jgi:hypothetical protein